MSRPISRTILDKLRVKYPEFNDSELTHMYDNIIGDSTENPTDTINDFFSIHDRINQSNHTSLFKAVFARLEGKFGIRASTKARLDLTVMLVTVADIVWLLCDMFTHLKGYHFIVLTLLVLGFMSGLMILHGIMKGHHQKHYNSSSKRVYEPPRGKHSEK